MIYEHLALGHPAEKVLQAALNRPREFNSLNRQTIQELTHVVEAFENSEDEFLILTGSGRAFCFGADFNEFQNREVLPQLLNHFQELIRKIYHCSKITVASLNGFATGAGLDLALACDFRIAGKNIKLGEAYISMGLVPDGGGTFFLPRLVGLSRSLEMLLKGDSVSAEEAMEMGLVHRVSPSNELAVTTLQLVQELSAKPKTAMRLIKALVKNPSITLEDCLKREREAQLICFEDPDHRKLSDNFLSKKRKKSN